MSRWWQHLRWFILAHGAASLVHFVHNAVYLDAYPNLPSSLTPLNVMLVWFAMAAMGLAGFILDRHRFPRLGLVVLAGFAATGYAGLLHYARASWSQHTLAMNATILLESITATLLLCAITISASAVTRSSERPKEPTTVNES